MVIKEFRTVKNSNFDDILGNISLRNWLIDKYPSYTFLNGVTKKKNRNFYWSRRENVEISALWNFWKYV